MRAVVTGGAGFIGSHLCERLAQEHEVLAIDNLSMGSMRTAVLEEAGVQLDTTDIRQEKLRSVISGFNPDLIFHLAAQIDVRKSVQDPILDAKVNIVGTIRVLEAARDSKSKVIFTSTGGAIYGEPRPEGLPVPEDAPLLPMSPYGISKRVAEDYLSFFRAAYGVPFVCLRPANVYGPRQDPLGEAGVVTIFASKLLKATECVIFGDGKQTRDFVFVEDLVEAAVAASKAPETAIGESFNIGSGVETSIDDLYWELASICKVEQPPRHEPEKPGEVRRISLEPAKAHRVLGWKQRVGLREGLEQTVDWLRSVL